MSIERKHICREGDWFLVPLTSDVAVMGVVARAGRGAMLFGYFFGPEHGNAIEAAEKLDVGSSILLDIFSALSIWDGTWPILGRTPRWERDSWPVPRFWRGNEDSPWGWVVEYPKGDIRFRPTVTRSSRAAAGPLPPERAAGAGAVETRLRMLLGLPHPPDPERWLSDQPVPRAGAHTAGETAPPARARVGGRRSSKRAVPAPAPGGPEGGRPGGDGGAGGG